MNHTQHMLTAIKLSEESVRNGGGPFAAVIVKDNKIIAQGNNGVTAHNDPTAHGEIVAIRNACANLNTFDLSGCTLYTSAEPCPMCFGAIYWAHIDAVYYGNTAENAAEIGFDDSLIYTEIAKDKKERSIPFTQLCSEEAHTAFKLWEINESKIEY